MGRAHPLTDVTVLDLEGRPVRLGDLWKDRRAVLVFVRHFGCLFCRQQVAELTPYLGRIRATGADVFLVGNGTVDDARASELAEAILSIDSLSDVLPLADAIAGVATA